MYDTYENPLCSRYASKQMQTIFGDRYRIMLWRKLWLALAQSEMELGLPITQEQIEQMREHLVPTDEEFKVAKERESVVNHDVMSHIYSFGETCPLAKPILHLGATSCFVTDNSELIQMYDGLKLIRSKVLEVIRALCDFSIKYKDVATVGYTHFQTAQFTTVGKRATLYLQDFVADYIELNRLLSDFKLRGAKGTTGTQAGFLELFKGNKEKVKLLDRLIAKKMGFEDTFGVTGQTYPRKFDYKIISVLCGIAISCHKYAVDMRLLQNLKELEEPFGKSQVGSSAMAYKRNPMNCERICSISRFVQSLLQNSAVTASTQWLERTLDDSANRRLSNAQAFLGIDSILSIVEKVVANTTVYENVIKKHVMEELPFIATENILMRCVELGGDRQELHERIRTLSMETTANIKNGGENDLMKRICQDSAFKPFLAALEGANEAILYTGCATTQTEEYVDYVLNVISE
ncbi:MAG: adenylosuccinate lyase [Clostridia bacterium]